MSLTLRLTNKSFEGLTSDQKKGLEFLKDFVESNRKIAVISGSPGTGKTFLMDRFNASLNCLCGVSAPTHKAKNVLESRLGVEGKTIQGLLGLRPKTELVNYDIDNVIFAPIVPPELQNYQVTIIDECSQLNSGVLDLIEHLCEQYDVKVVFVGDKNQLPCVIKDSNDIEYPEVFVKYADSCFELREVVRQEIDNPLLNLIIACRNDIETGSNDFEKMIKNSKIESNPKGKGYCYLNRKTFESQILKEYQKISSNNINYIRMLCYSNDKVTSWNNYLRSNLLGYDDESDILNENDILMSYNTIFLERYSTNLITNSTDYLIKSISKQKESNGLDVYKIKLIDCLTNENSIKFMKVINHNDESTFKIYYEHLSALHEAALNANLYDKKIRWRDYYKYKDNYLSMQSFKLKSGSKLTKDLDYGYALTIHKSQGCTFNRVGVDLKDIYCTPNTKLKKRLLYVALSRPTDVAYICA